GLPGDTGSSLKSENNDLYDFMSHRGLRANGAKMYYKGFPGMSIPYIVPLLLPWPKFRSNTAVL
ncbi:hypothetical protein EA500_24580, partial [Salmonella enterica subsp. enterica serovar Oranienburg]|nr:hypothetical protein [Salmonella enterica subsp. enterica serovar Pomona]EAA8400107.1 hypothetical protein [Salmonella enterica subsp. enterica serovar Oranienburg]EAM5645026.1 hypothetical protein [Salmonella enterica]EAN3311640.1 hypothetical protein [Salmonella enterica subsp. enterica serovar Give]EAA8414031.1 hypothetical protein [Salmonella enterica subsp. enterica serovar Oranienburg]